VGDADAREKLLVLYRDRLRQMVRLRMDRRMAGRVDPSDVVQEALADAAQNLDAYLDNPPLPFYPWLRQIAWERLLALHHKHVTAQCRSVKREERADIDLPDESVLGLAGRLMANGTSPSRHLLRAELRQRMHGALARLGTRDSEILMLRYLEQMSIDEIAATLGLSQGAVKTRQTRALIRLRDLLSENLTGEF
jgi:RNA polymerase sigma-70 factor (ECF subfamily)